MKLKRWMFLQSLIDRLGCKSYLEVGTAGGNSFTQIQCPHKEGVDVRGAHATFRGRSDSFFAQNTNRFDLVFVDGLHLCWQALRDVENALKVCDGPIVMHDCNPISEQRQAIPSPGVGGWNGDVWKAFVELRTRPNLDCACGDFDHGCGVVLQRPNSDPIEIDKDYSDLTWPELVANRQRWLRLMDLDKLTEWMED